VFFHWPAETLRDFYFRIADEADVETVSLGEVVCSKRMVFFEEHLPAVIERLQRGGKEVVLSSLSLVADKREIAAMKALVALAPGLVEANDVSVLSDLRGTPHAIGPFVNIYNEDTLSFLVGLGAVRACLNPELPGTLVAELARLSAIPLEVMVFGRLPLAISARCYHARIQGLAKDSCQFVCGQDPDGLAVDTLDGEHFLAVNGVQTLSSTYADLLGDLAALSRAGIRSLRLSPHSCDMVAVAQIFHDAAEGRCAPAEAKRRLSAELPAAAFSNGFLHGKPGWRQLQAAE
jgi:collagenase-like PrtC family protease